MKAIIYKEYGAPSVLHLADVPKPSPKPDEVLVKIHAVSINDWDWAFIGGDLFTRVTNGLFKPKKITILGSDIAGVVESVGTGITQFKPGDEVFGDLSTQWGGFAEYVCVKEKMIAIKPKSMSFEQAAAMPQAGMLAVQGLIDVGKLKPGQKILINGAGGGVGTYGVQIAKHLGVGEITGVDNDGKLELMRSMGFDHVIDYRKQDFTKNGQRYDLIVDTKTNRSPFKYLKSLSPNGIYATVGGSLGKLLLVFLFGGLIKLFTKKTVRLVVLKTNKDLGYMSELFEAGKLKSIIDGPYKLEDVPRAFEIFGEMKHKGKMVVTI